MRCLLRHRRGHPHLALWFGSQTIRRRASGTAAAFVRESSESISARACWKWRGEFRNQANQPPVEFVQGDVLTMAFREEFDLAVTVGSLGHILPKDEPRFVERVAAALKPGGRFAFVTSERPPLWSPRYLLSRGFNTAMHVRNAIKRPPFIMFYLTFLLPHVRRLLQNAGFDVAVHDDAFRGRFRGLQVVVWDKTDLTALQKRFAKAGYSRSPISRTTRNPLSVTRLSGGACP